MMDRQCEETAQCLVRDFRQRIILIDVLYFGVAAVILYSACVLSNPLHYLPVYLIVLLINGSLRGFIRQFLYVPINTKLYQDCDPLIYHTVYLTLQQVERQPLYRRVCTLNVANAIYYMGDHEGAIGFLKNNVDLGACNFSQWLNYQNILANCYACRPDLEALREIQQELFQAQSLRLKKAERSGLAACLQIVGIYVSLFSGDYEYAKTQCETRLSTSGLKFQKIGLRFRLGYIEAAQGNLQSAQEHLHYVIQNGGGLCFVKRARLLLAELQRPAASAE